MRFTVTVKPNCKQQKIEMAADGVLKIWLRSPPVDGKANVELLKLLAKHFKVRRSQVVILRGKTNRQKLIEIDGL